jgi:EAL domain-containing protein (putative c-di-GMP-specific phosphodiesterase class I)
LRAWDRQGLPPIGVSVNVSARQFAFPELVDSVEAAVDASGLAPGRLELEVTQSTLADPDGAQDTLRRLRDIGVGVAIDDFGTGFSSLAYLNRLPISAIKLDRSFVSPLGDDLHAADTVTAVIGLAHQLELSTVAEGVENERQAGFLQAQGCDRLQGFGVCRPMPSHTASGWLGERARTVAATPADA